MTRFILGLAFLLSGCAAGPHGARTAAPPVGLWVGSAAQYDSGTVGGAPDSEWTVEVSLGETSRVSYPSLGCSGTLTYRSMTDSGAAVYIETITSGQDRCVTSGRIELMPDGRQLRYSASHESQPSVSVGVLTHP